MTDAAQALPDGARLVVPPEMIAGFQSSPPRLKLPGGVDLFEAMLAGMLVCLGIAQSRHLMPWSEAYQSLTEMMKMRMRAEQMPPDSQRYHDAMDELADLVCSMTMRLSQAPDWQDRALAAESRLEGQDYLVGLYERSVREIIGRPGSMHDVKCHIESLEGRVIAADQRAAEQAVFALSLLNHLREMPTRELRSDLEMVHHSVCASPRTAESEAVSQEIVNEEVARRHGAEHTRLLDQVVAEQEETGRWMDKYGVASRHVEALREQLNNECRVRDTIFNDLCTSSEAWRVRSYFMMACGVAIGVAVSALAYIVTT